MHGDLRPGFRLRFMTGIGISECSVTLTSSVATNHQLGFAQDCKRASCVKSSECQFSSLVISKPSLGHTGIRGLRQPIAGRPQEPMDQKKNVVVEPMPQRRSHMRENPNTTDHGEIFAKHRGVTSTTLHPSPCLHPSPSSQYSP